MGRIDTDFFWVNPLFLFSSNHDRLIMRFFIPCFHKNHYFVVVAGFLLVVSNALGQGQPPSPETPEATAIRGRKSTAPFLGITVNIPLWKIFGKKKAKALPEMPQTDAASFYADERLPVVPEPMALSGDTVEVGFKPVVQDTARYDLDEVIIRAPRLENPPPSGTGGGSGGGGAPRDQEEAPPTNGGGNSSEEPAEDNCQQCKANARAALKVAQDKFLAARDIFDAEHIAIQSYVNYSQAGCTAVAIGWGLGLISVGGQYAVSIPTAALVAAAVVGSSVFIAAVCLKSLADEVNLRLLKAGNDFRTASTENDQAIMLYNNTLQVVVHVLRGF